MTKSINFIFIGTSKFAAIILENIIKKNQTPYLVITQPDKEIGRKKIITPPPVKQIAQKYNISVLQPVKIKNYESQIKEYKPDLIIVADYGQIIPKKILDIPKFNCLNIHPSLLPLYRGPSPIQETIINGDKITGVTIIKMDEKIDHGPIIKNLKMKMQNLKINYEELSNKLAQLGAKLLIGILPKWIDRKIIPQPQNEKRATYTKIITKRDGRISWQNKAEIIERQIRAYTSWPTTYTFWQNKTLKILSADIYSNNFCLEPGRVFKTENGEIAVATKEKSLLIKKLQLEGKNHLNNQEFLNGYPQIIGSILK